MKSLLYLFFSFRGRISRKQWWFGFVVWWLYAFFLGFCAGLMEVFIPVDWHGWTLLPAWVVVFYPVLAFHIKRYHDQNRPFWWLLIVFILTSGVWFFLTILAVVLGADFKIFVFIFWIYIFGVRRGDTGKNRYGPPPKPLLKMFGVEI